MVRDSYEAVKQFRWTARRRLILGFGGACGICRLIDDDCVYDFHHLDSDSKDFNISGRIRSWSSLVKEAKKCVMLCVICHRKLHAGLILLPSEVPRFDETLVPKFVCVKGELAFNECPKCGGPKRTKQKYCSVQCGSSELMVVKSRTWSSGSRKGIKMPRYWSRRPKKDFP